MTNNIYETPGSELNTTTLEEKPIELSPEDQKLTGLGGWLILVGFGVIFAPLRLLFVVYTVFVPIFSDGTWDAITNANSEYYIPYIGAYLAFELVVNSALILASIYLIYLFFKKHYLFPKVYIVIVVFSMLFIVFDAFIGGQFFPEDPIFDEDTLKELGRGLSSVFIWIPYMLMSKRVKLTFIENKPAK